MYAMWSLIVTSDKIAMAYVEKLTDITAAGHQHHKMAYLWINRRNECTMYIQLVRLPGDKSFTE